MTATHNRQRLRYAIPDYSPCCNAPILPQPGRLYCHGCDRTLIDLDGANRHRALSVLRWVRWWPNDVSLMWRNLRVAYARDWLEYAPDCKTVERVSYLWVIGCSGADFGRIATALRLLPENMSYPGRDGFATLARAADDLQAVLDRLGPGIPHWSTAPPFKEKT